MAFLGFGTPQPTSAQKIAAAEQELEMVTDMFNRLSNSCTKKCIPSEYKEADLNKGESVCLDRCVAKFFEVNIKVLVSFSFFSFFLSKTCNSFFPVHITEVNGQADRGGWWSRYRNRCRLCKQHGELVALVPEGLEGLGDKLWKFK
jgi:import inner membrane translocase subunit TIM10